MVGETERKNNVSLCCLLNRSEIRSNSFEKSFKQQEIL